MYLDDLPIWGLIGKHEVIRPPGQSSHVNYFLYPHISFDVRYNGAHLPELPCRAVRRGVSAKKFMP